ncbi:hypothetical protein L195_g008193 [Trifolium pratense]|uniref:Uncharacterized protein n=1 Tax=Trifolium pratense TaxID=57577 RepID=A0A2K3P8I1_TRIPR|nr:hypothetical protein L195_g008193 [Trifolium pratense]
MVRALFSAADGVLSIGSSVIPHGAAAGGILSVRWSGDATKKFETMIVVSKLEMLNIFTVKVVRIKILHKIGRGEQNRKT